MSPDRIQRRTLRLNVTRADDRTRTISASLSSEKPVVRWYGIEVLDHSPKAVDLSRAVNGTLPLLVSHDPMEVPRGGNVEAIHLSGKRLVGRLRFASNKRGEELWAGVQEGVVDSISISYEILEQRQEGTDKETGLPIFRVTRWRVLEVSVVNIPADETVGIGRSQETMEQNDGAPEVRGGIEDREERFRHNSILKASNALLEMIATTDILHRKEQAARHVREQTELALASGTSAKEFREKVDLGKFVDGREAPNLNGQVPLTQSNGSGIGLHGRDLERYSLRKAILASTGDAESRREAGLEIEVSRAVAQATGRQSAGIIVPFEAMRPRGPQRRDLTTTGSAGGYLINTEIPPGSFIDVLRNASCVLRAGATQLLGLNGGVTVPRKASGTTAYWVAEGSNLTESTITLEQIAFTAKTCGGWAEFTRRFLLQSSLDAEALIVDDLGNMLAAEIDRVAIKGGGSGEPSGVLTLPAGIGNVDMGNGTDGGAPTWLKLVSFIGTVAQANALQGRLSWITNGKVLQKCLSTVKESGQASYLFDAAAPGSDALATCAGYPVYVTGNVPSTLTKGASVSVCSAMLFGNWADFLIAQWGPGVEFLSDPYTNFASGNVRVRAMIDLDMAVRHAQSFCISDEVLTT